MTLWSTDTVHDRARRPNSVQRVCRLYIRLEWEGLRQVMLSLDLVQSIAALACCVNEALLRFHVRSVNEKTYV